MLDIEGNLTVLLKSAFNRVTTDYITSSLGRLPLLVMQLKREIYD